MDQLPPPKFPQARQWRFNRKRRRSGTEAGESESNYLSIDSRFYLTLPPLQATVKWSRKRMQMEQLLLAQLLWQWTLIRNKKFLQSI